MITSDRADERNVREPMRLRELPPELCGLRCPEDMFAPLSDEELAEWEGRDD